MMTKPTFAIAVTFRIVPEFLVQFRTRVLQQARDSLDLEPGCRQFDVLADESDPTMIFLYETYIDAEAFSDHKETAHFLAFDAEVTPWVASKEVRRLNLLEN